MLNPEIRKHAMVIEGKFEYHKWSDEIPYLKFPQDWEVKPVPPTMNAIIRFWVKNRTDKISVYLDCYDQLGYVGQPYWEVYPVMCPSYGGGGEPDETEARFLMNETDELIRCIQSQLDGEVWDG